MKIGVISDTHMPKKGNMFPKDLVKGLQDVDYIIHAGDWSEMIVRDLLENIAPVIGVHGNVDSPEIKASYPRQEIIELNRFRIGIVHGHEGKSSYTTAQRAYASFSEENINCIIFGHSHIPYKQLHEETILFNPGSPTDKRFQSFYSYGVMEITNEINIQLMTYQNKR